jgi:hypothetical protein
MVKQTRTRCTDCRREWVDRQSTLGQPEGNCWACGSQQLEVVQFEGFFDIDTAAAASVGLEPLTPPAALKTDIQEPPLTLVQTDDRDAAIPEFA